MAHIITKLNNAWITPRTFIGFLVLSVSMLLLSACASIVPFQYTVSKKEVEDAVFEHLSKPATFLGLYNVVFARPAIELLPDEQRIRVTQKLALTERLSGRAFDGLAVFSTGLKVLEEGRTVKLSKIRIEKVFAPGLAGGANIAQQAIATLLEPELEKFLVFKIPQKGAPPVNFRINGIQIEVDRLLLDCYQPSSRLGF